MCLKIFLQPIGPVNLDVLSFLEDTLASIWPTEVIDQIDIPVEAYNKTRNQYKGMSLLNALIEKEGATLGITEVDAYVEGLNFIFGLALGRKALISLKRLKPEFHNFPSDKDLLKLRALKEAVHELGHVFNLRHCSDRKCVMHFSNSIWDTDFKDWKFCGLCEQEIAKKGSWID